MPIKNIAKLLMHPILYIVESEGSIVPCPGVLGLEKCYILVLEPPV